MGIMLRQAGDVSRALATLGFAAQTYPQDATTQYNLALAQDSPNQIEQLRRVIELDPDVVPAYQIKVWALRFMRTVSQRPPSK